MRDLDLEMSERIATLEQQRKDLRDKVSEHEAEIRSVKTDITHIVNDVRQIRNALYVMAVALACNVPFVAKILEHFIGIF